TAEAVESRSRRSLVQSRRFRAAAADGKHLLDLQGRMASSEVVAEGASRTEWQWTKKEASIAFRNPKRDVTLFLQVDNPAGVANSAQQGKVQLGDQMLATVPLSATKPP